MFKSFYSHQHLKDGDRALKQEQPWVKRLSREGAFEPDVSCALGRRKCTEKQSLRQLEEKPACRVSRQGVKYAKSETHGNWKWKPQSQRLFSFKVEVKRVLKFIQQMY